MHYIWQLVIQLLLFHPKTAPKAISEGLKSKIFLGDMSPRGTPPSALYEISHVHTGTPLFKILDLPLVLIYKQPTYIFEFAVRLEFFISSMYLFTARL